MHSASIVDRPLRKLALVTAIFATTFAAIDGFAKASQRPNIVLIMADDLGWGDVAFNGNTKVRTPALDLLAREGVRLDRFYAGGPVCTPTRASCLTGRNPNRFGTEWAGDYPLPQAERTIAELLRDAGYRTGHFGKWHLGKMTPDRAEGFGDKKGPTTYVAPWHQGFDECFSTESAAPNYNPAVWGKKWDLGTNNPNVNLYIMDRPLVYGEGTLTGEPMQRWPFDFWLGEGRKAPDTIAGDSSELIMNHAVPFIEQAARDGAPFLAVVWFVTPHTPVAAGPEFRALYPQLSIREQHWFGAISALDAQVGRLLETLKRLQLEENTIVWFCSDNGPSWVHELNSAGPFRGKKSELYEGGIRVPAVVRWPAALKGGRMLDTAFSTNDFLPTLLAAANVSPPGLPPIDGENMLPVLQGSLASRARPIFFDYPYRDTENVTWVPTSTRQVAVMDGPWKLLSVDGQKTFELYDLSHDRSEKTSVAAAQPDRVKAMQRMLAQWQESCARSKSGADYPKPAAP